MLAPRKIRELVLEALRHPISGHNSIPKPRRRRQVHNFIGRPNQVRRQYGARRIRVFGSVARGEERSDSDIDFLVDFPRGYDLFAQRLPLAERLTQITGRRLDLIPEHELSRHLRDAVLKEAVEL